MDFVLWLFLLISLHNSITVCSAESRIMGNVRIDQMTIPFNVSTETGIMLSCNDTATSGRCNVELKLEVYDTFDKITGSFKNDTSKNATVSNFHHQSTVVNATDQSAVSILKPSSRPLNSNEDFYHLTFAYKGIYPDYLLLRATLLRAHRMIDWWIINLTAKWNEQKTTAAFGSYDLYPYGKRNRLFTTHRVHCEKDWYTSQSNPDMCDKHCVEDPGFKVCDKFGNLVCTENKHGANCLKRCTPTRNKQDGFQGCDDNGTVICAGGAKPPKCDVPFCDKDWCKNEGLCRIIKKQVRCICKPGFSGSRCETESTCTSKTPNLWPKNEVKDPSSCMETFSCACFGFKEDAQCHRILETNTKFGEFMSHWGNFIALVSVTSIILIALPLSTWILTIVGERFGYLV